MSPVIIRLLLRYMIFSIYRTVLTPMNIALEHIDFILYWAVLILTSVGFVGTRRQGLEIAEIFRILVFMCLSQSIIYAHLGLRPLLLLTMYLGPMAAQRWPILRPTVAQH